MKNYSAIICAGVLALALSACGGGGDEPDGVDTSIQPVDGEVVDDPSVVASGTVDAAAPRQTSFGAGALVTSPVNGKVRSLPSLTPSASAEARINSTSSGKSDPFAGRVISVRPVPPEPGEVEATFPLAGSGTSPSSNLGNALAGGDSSSGASVAGAASRSGVTPAVRSGGTTPAARSGGSSAVSRGASTGSGNNASGSASGSTPSASSNSGSGSVGSGSLPDLAARPPIPDPALARAVEVTGVVLVGSNYQAIVKAPNEPTSRYVTAGQRLSGGRVLVKRIENQGSEPVVILEEDGVEVVRSIGAPSEGAAGDATAMLPELMPAS